MSIKQVELLCWPQSRYCWDNGLSQHGTTTNSIIEALLSIDRTSLETIKADIDYLIQELRDRRNSNS